MGAAAFLLPAAVPLAIGAAAVRGGDAPGAGRSTPDWVAIGRPSRRRPQASLPSAAAALAVLASVPHVCGCDPAGKVSGEVIGYRAGMAVRVVTDSTAYLPAPSSAAARLEVVPLTVTVSGRDGREGVDVSRPTSPGRWASGGSR